MSDLAGLREDLEAEQRALDAIVQQLSTEQFQWPTPSPGWSVHDQVAHLTYFDGTAALAVTDPTAFAATLADLFAAATSTGIDDYTLGSYRALTAPELIAAWRANRASLLDAAQTVPDNVRIPWYGPSMSPRSFLTARLMEVWAHGTDIVDAVGAIRPASDRLWHIAQLGFMTRGWSYTVRGRDVPDTPVRLELTAPSGVQWTWGPSDAAESVKGSAEQFCTVVTQRRHLDDTALTVTPVAREWLLIAQAFAGGATDGPPPRHLQ